jgi:hypothetical protein
MSFEVISKEIETGKRQSSLGFGSGIGVKFGLSGNLYQNSFDDKSSRLQTAKFNKLNSSSTNNFGDLRGNGFGFGNISISEGGDSSSSGDDEAEKFVQ